MRSLCGILIGLCLAFVTSLDARPRAPWKELHSNWNGSVAGYLVFEGSQQIPYFPRWFGQASSGETRCATINGSRPGRSGLYLQTGVQNFELSFDGELLEPDARPGPHEYFYDLPLRDGNLCFKSLDAQADPDVAPRLFRVDQGNLNRVRDALVEFPRARIEDGVVDLSGPVLIRTLERGQARIPDLRQSPNDSMFSAMQPGPLRALIPSPFYGRTLIRFSFRCNPDCPPGLSLYLGSISSPDETFLNGVRIGNTGKAGSVSHADYDRARLYVLPDTVLRTGGTNTIEIITDSEAVGRPGLVMAAPFVLGLNQHVQDLYLKSEIYNVAPVVLFAAIGIFFLLMFVRRVDVAENLVFALFSLIMAAYFFLRTQSKFFYIEDFELSKRLEYCAIVLAFPLFALFMQQHFLSKRTITERIWRGLFALYCIAIALTVVYYLTSEGYDEWHRVFGFVVTSWILPGSYVIYLLIREAVGPLRAEEFRSRSLVRRFDAFVKRQRNNWNRLVTRFPRYLESSLRVRTAGRPRSTNRTDALLMAAGVLALFGAAYHDSRIAFADLVDDRWGAPALMIFMLGNGLILINRMHRLNQQLRLRNQALRRLDTLKDEFLAHTSHELRSPLTSIIAIAESLLEGIGGRLTITSRDNLGLIVDSARRLTELVDDILDFARMRHSHIELRLTAVEMRPAAELVISLSRTLLLHKPVKLVNSVPADLPPVAADEARLQQILHNLVGNAIKFTNEGEIEIDAVVEGRYLRVSVCDTGIGIPTDRLSAIFDRFEQASGQTARHYGGTGLGLSLARHLVELQGGRISAQSAPGRGSCFHFTLPLADERLITTGASLRLSRPRLTEARSRKSPDPSHSSPGRERVLVVEDDAIIMRAVANNLELEGYEVIEAGDGQSALDMLVQNVQACDLVLADIMMPRLSGFDLCREIRKRPDLAALPVILMTAGNRPADVSEGFAAGANDYVKKPFTRQELLARIGFHLRLRRTAERLQELNENLERAVQERTRELNVLLGDLRTRDREIQMELDLARAIQRGILPGDHNAELFELCAYHRPMGKVGGDYYDIFRTPGGEEALLLADVSGHGIPAALISTMARIAFSDAFRQVSAPRDVFARVDEALSKSVITHDYLTAVLLVFDASGRLRFSSASHRTAYLLKRSGGAIVPLTTEGLLIGFADQTGDDFEERECPVEAGDRILAYTDGFVERMDRHDRVYGEERLVYMFESTRDLSLPEAQMAMVRDWEEHAQSRPPLDDVCLLLLEVRNFMDR